MREQQQEAYAACLRAIYAHPHLSDPLEMDAFLTSARKMLHITNPGAILESVRTDLELIRQGQVVRAGSGTPVMGAGPIGAPSGGRGSAGPKSRAGGAFKTPSQSKSRSRNTRSTGTVDPEGLVGRRVWRYYPNEDQNHPWVEGFFTGYDRSLNTYTITYDPNTASVSEEAGFSLEYANPAEYVLGDYAFIQDQNGSRRQSERPADVKVQSPIGQGPSKRRRNGVKIPTSAPFQPLWFEGALQEGSRADLDIMLTMLELKEKDLLDAIQWAEKALEMGVELDSRLRLEAEFEALIAKERHIESQLVELRRPGGVGNVAVGNGVPA
jgi:hypothetical protein